VRFNVTTTVTRGWEESGERACLTSPGIRSRNVTVMAGMTDSEVLHYEILEGNGNNLSFQHFLDDMAHHRDIKHLANNSVIVMDNVAYHRHAHVIEMMIVSGDLNGSFYLLILHTISILSSAFFLSERTM